jgi:hypothetical protein
VQLSSYHSKPLCHFFVDIVSRPIEWLESPRFQFRVTFAEGLRPVLARGSNPVIGSRDLESGGPLTGDPLRQVSQEFDRDREAQCGRAQNIVNKGFFFGRSKVLSFDCDVLP